MPEFNELCSYIYIGLTIPEKREETRERNLLVVFEARKTSNRAKKRSLCTDKTPLIFVLSGCARSECGVQAN